MTYPIIAAILLMASFAHGQTPSCESLKGRFQCVDEYGDITDIAIEFPSPKEVLLGEHRLPWNQWVKLADDADLVNRTGHAQCLEQKLVTAFAADDINSRGEVTGKMTWQSTWEKSATGLRVVSEGVLTPTRGRQPIPFKGSFSCTYERVNEDPKQCPDLSGTYTCPLYSRQQVVKIEISRSTNGTVTYAIDGEKLTADGVVRDLSETGVYRNGTSRAYCQDQALSVELNGDYYPQNQFAGRMRLLLKRTRAPDGSLEIVNQGSLQVGDQLLPLRGHGICTRN